MRKPNPLVTHRYHGTGVYSIRAARLLLNHDQRPGVFLAHLFLVQFFQVFLLFTGPFLDCYTLS